MAEWLRGLACGCAVAMALSLGACAMGGGSGDGSDPVADSEAPTAPATASSAAPSAAPSADRVFVLGGEGFAFPAGALLQTWPIMFGQPNEFARLAVQMPASALAPDDLAGIDDPVQVDVLAANFVPDPTARIAGGFSDWTGREEQPAGSTYKFTITSLRGDTGAKIAYLRQQQKVLGLESLAPFHPQAGAPIFVFGRDGARITTLIECGPLWARYEGLNYCSLRRALDDRIGYGVMFPQDLLVHWRVFDEAARDFVRASRQ